MTNTHVGLAPVPADILESALGVPALKDRVAFGSSAPTLATFPIGLTMYIFVSHPPHKLFVRGAVSWTGKLIAIVPAEISGRRSGKHSNPAVRPPFAEEGDTPVKEFWEIEELTKLAKPIALSRFEGPFSGGIPQWPVLASLKKE